MSVVSPGLFMSWSLVFGIRPFVHMPRHMKSNKHYRGRKDIPWAKAPLQFTRPVCQPVSHYVGLEKKKRKEKRRKGNPDSKEHNSAWNIQNSWGVAQSVGGTNNSDVRFLQFFHSFLLRLLKWSVFIVQRYEGIAVTIMILMVAPVGSYWLWTGYANRMYAYAWVWGV